MRRSVSYHMFINQQENELLVQTGISEHCNRRKEKKKITTVINWKLECQFLNWGLVSRNTGLRFSVGDSFTP